MSPDECQILISMVVATIGRSTELNLLFRSVVNQNCSDIEIIVVDQNGDDRLEPVLAEHRGKLRLVHLRTLQQGVCRARNLGASRATGDWLLFPDDDCWYPKDFLQRLRTRLAWDDADFVAGRAADESGRDIMGAFERRPARIVARNVWTTMIEWVFCVRRRAFEKAGGFDERIGPGAGTRWGAYEVQDLALSLLETGARGAYDPALYGHHPEDSGDRTTDANIAKIRTYSGGLGYIVRKHRYSPAFFVTKLLRPVAGMVVYSLLGRPRMAYRSSQILAGRWDGWRKR
ncbi:glycosyltransferase family 2 protein [Rhizobium sp. TRM95111]|uniref:glycosyltransferase family 2 protein n=1 Tax=Rhizobium alarense TaxID=2846851 RepID=UPI001F3451DC|nr:glycosyltransferase family A protein [Rhizobium alarense]MCF3640461.1 glycosyltransferase family 2 protein [Rhizobium alarense]